MTHLVKLHTESEPFYAMTEWNKDQTSVDVKLLQKDKAWKFVLNGNDMGAVAKKLQVFPRIIDIVVYIKDCPNGS